MSKVRRTNIVTISFFRHIMGIYRRRELLIIMKKSFFTCESSREDFISPKYVNMPQYTASISVKPKTKKCSKCNNLVQNASFEAGLAGWEWTNVTLTNSNPFEGTQAALLGEGVASLYQDVSLHKLANNPLLLSFNVFPGSDAANNGELIAEAIWLDTAGNPIAAGLRLFIPDGRIDSRSRQTYFDITDIPPTGAAWARIQFSKGPSLIVPDTTISIDQVILAPVDSINLVQNPGFEAGLAHWASDPDTSFVPSFSLSYEGAGHTETAANGVLFQDVPLNKLPARSSFLLSFAAFANGAANLSIRVEWRNAADDPIGSGLNLFIPNVTLVDQLNYLSYLEITDRAPYGTVKARISFAAGILEPETSLHIDQVLFARVASENLVVNPSFGDSLNGWTPVNTELRILGNNIYEGREDALVPEIGGSLVQDVCVPQAAGHCFLFNCGLAFRALADNPDFGTMLIKVIWLNKDGSEIGLGLSLISRVRPFGEVDPHWLVYTGFTEPAPKDTAAARLQFSKTSGVGGIIEIDKLVFGRLV